MADTFTWRPKYEVEAAHRLRTLSVQFGDGYKQAVGDGVNNETQAWRLTFIGKKAKIDAIRDFLRAQGGYTPFWWRPTGETAPLLFECSEFNLNFLGNNIWTLTATFSQRFDPES